MTRFLSLLAAICCSATVMAQSEGYKVYDFTKCTFDITDQDGETWNTFLFGYFNHVSANGKYAVGTDEELMFRSYLWSADEPTKIEMFGEYTSEIALYDVTNDGTLVGGIRNSEGMMYPAYKPLNGNWQMLTRGMENLNYDMAIDDYVNQALRATTPDGKYMAGSFYMNTGDVTEDGYEISHLIPIVWEDGMIKKVYDDLGIKEFMVWDISDDGSTICGANTAGIGGQNPAFIRDGKLIELFKCGDERTEDTPDDVYGNTDGGICNSIDNEGNIYGYYAEAYGNSYFSMSYFVVPAGCDYAIFLDEAYTNNDFPEEFYTDEWFRCGGNGRAYTNDDSNIYSLLDCSDDGKVFVGGGAYNVGFGIANIPQLCIYDEALTPSSLRNITDAKEAQGISFNGRTVIVKGLYDEATVIDAQGAILAKAHQGQPIALPHDKGVYIINVKYADGIHCYKVNR